MNIERGENVKLRMQGEEDEKKEEEEERSKVQKSR